MSILAQVVEWRQANGNCMGHPWDCRKCPGHPRLPGLCFGLNPPDHESFAEVWDRITAEAVRRLSLEQLSKI